MAKTTAVYVDDGCGQDSTGDDVHEFYVTPGDDDGEPTGEYVTVGSRSEALRVADEMSKKYGGVEVVEV